MITLYCLRFETTPTWRASSPHFYPTGTGWPGYTPGTGFPFSRLLGFSGLRWRYSTPPPHGKGTNQSQSYFTTGGLLPINLSWRQAPWDSWPVELIIFFPFTTYWVSDTTRTAQKTPRSIVILLREYSLPRNRLCEATTYKQPSLLAPLFRLSGVGGRDWHTNSKTTS
jgi:hypothetical protein